MAENQLPKGWGLEPVSKLLTLFEIGARPKGGAGKLTEGVPSISAEHFNYGGQFKFQKMKYIPEDFFESLKKGVLEKGDVIVVKDGATTGKSAFIEDSFPFEKAAVNEHTFILRSSNETTSKLIFYFTCSLTFERFISVASGGSTIGGIKKGFVDDLRIPLPPLAEQQRIVAKLDKLFAHLEETKTRLNKIPQLLKNFRQSVLTQAVTGKLTEDWREENKPNSTGLIEIESKINLFPSEFEGNIPTNWKLLKAESICFKITDGEHQTPKRIDEGKMLLSAKNVRSGFLDYSVFDCISEEDFDKCLKRCYAEKDDILIVSVGATIGRAAIVDGSEKFALVRSVALLKPKEEINGKYLLFVIQSNTCQTVIENVSQGSAQACLYLSKIKGLPIPVPSFEEQGKIVDLVDLYFNRIQVIEEKYNHLKKKIENLPQSILAKAFKGELVEQLPTDGDAQELLDEIKKLKAQTTKKKK